MIVTAAEIKSSLAPWTKALQGDPGRALGAARSINQPAPGTLSYLKPSFFLTDALHTKLAGMALICSEAHARQLAGVDVTCLISDNPRLAFIRAVNQFFSRPRPVPGIHPRAVVDASASIDATATIGANCYVGVGCVVGPRSVLFPNVTLLDDVRIGADVTIGSGTVVGGEGFGYERNEELELEKFPHLGGVLIEDNVEIGSNTSIDRGTLGDTIIRRGARIDNQCHISHNVVIGQHSAVIAQSMVGGSAIVGDYSWLAPASIIMNQAKLGERSTVGLGAVVVKDVPAGLTVIGSPAIPADDFRAQRAAIKKLIE